MAPGAIAVNAVDQSKSDPVGFLRTLFNGLIYKEFRFPVVPGDGIIGNYCISKGELVTLGRPANDNLAVHVNFGVKPSQYLGDGKLKLELTQLHLTARAWKSQLLINADGPSKLTAAASIHINCNTEWGRDDNLRMLAENLNMTKEGLSSKLTQVEGYNQAFMRMMSKELRAAITRTASINIGQVSIQFETDSTWP